MFPIRKEDQTMLLLREFSREIRVFTVTDCLLAMASPATLPASKTSPSGQRRRDDDERGLRNI